MEYGLGGAKRKRKNKKKNKDFKLEFNTELAA